MNWQPRRGLAVTVMLQVMRTVSIQTLPVICTFKFQPIRVAAGARGFKFTVMPVPVATK